MINITKRGWRHILQHHTGSQFTRHRKKSKFYETEDLVKLINEAATHAPISHSRSNVERVFDAGHLVGTDRQDGKPTSIVTVLTRLNGDLVTMFPGHL
jgi:hypothetical protein